MSTCPACGSEDVSEQPRDTQGTETRPPQRDAYGDWATCRSCGQGWRPAEVEAHRVAAAMRRLATP